MSEKKRVAVGLSGGVDSALSAYLLKKQGYEVVGMTMATWDGSVKMPAVEGREGCYGPSEDKNIEEAKLVAERLGIPHYVVPVAEDYKREVLDYFRAEYRAGRTPNPCVRCNQSIKFGALQHAARKLGIDSSELILTTLRRDITRDLISRIPMFRSCTKHWTSIKTRRTFYRDSRQSNFPL